MTKIYFIYKFTNNPNPKETYRKLKEKFGEGYLFDEVHKPNENNLSREEIRKLFTKDMKKGNFDLVIVDTSYGFGRMMKEEIALAKELGIPIKEVNINKKKF